MLRITQYIWDRRRARDINDFKFIIQNNNFTTICHTIIEEYDNCYTNHMKEFETDFKYESTN